MRRVTKSFPKSILMALTSNFCQEHAKPVTKMMIDGEEVCPKCQLMKEVQEDDERFITEVLEKQAQKKKNTLYWRSLFADETIREASFGTFYCESADESTTKELAIKAFKHFKAGNHFTALLQGTTGTGKSHLAMAILRNLNEKLDVECVFISVREMMTKIRDSFNNTESIYTQLYFTELLSRCDFICLDDLGAETGAIMTNKMATNFTLEVITAILEARQNKATIITTNLNRSQLEKMYDKKLVSRSMKNIAVIPFKNIRDKRIVPYDLSVEI